MLMGHVITTRDSTKPPNVVHYNLSKSPPPTNCCMNRMTRRHLITATTSALAATALGRTVTPPARKRPIKIAVKYEMIQLEGSVLDKFKLAKAAGFEGIEPNGGFDADTLQAMVEASQATGIPIPGIVGKGASFMGSLDPAEQQQGLEAMEINLRQAQKLGATTVLLYPGKVDKDRPYHLVYETLLKNVRAILPVAKETGVKIALENVWNNLFLSPLDAVHFVDSINDPHVGWFFDIGNIARYGWPEQWIHALGKRILKLDIKGYSTTLHMSKGPGAGFRVQIGEDEIDWPAVMKAVDDIGYDGNWISAEVGGGGLQRLTQIQQQIDRVLNL